MRRPDIRFGHSDRRGHVTSQNLFNLGFCNRLSSIHKRKRGKRGGKLVKFRLKCRRSQSQYNLGECTMYNVQCTMYS